MTVCRNCGANIPDGCDHCQNCGASANGVVDGGRRGYEKDFIRTLPAEFRPLSPWAYFGYSLLFSIPLVGLVLVIVFACGGASNINLRKFARSFIILWVFGIIVSVILASVVVSVYSDYINYMFQMAMMG